MARCFALDCDEPVNYAKVMCGAHWKLVTPETRRELFRTYRHGQDTDGRPAPEEWMRWVRSAIIEVKEAHPVVG